MRAARATAKQGDIFTAEMQDLIRKAMAQIIARPDGRQIRSSILDENPVGVKIQVGCGDRMSSRPLNDDSSIHLFEKRLLSANSIVWKSALLRSSLV